MKIKKKLQSIGVVGRIFNTKSSSDKDTYSCKYIDDNFVNEEQLSYSSQEKYTGKKWLNGEKIFSKTYGIPNLGNRAIVPIENFDNINIVDFKAMATNNSNYFLLPFYRASDVFGIEFYINQGEGIVISAGNDRSGFKVYVTIYYTKK